MTELLLPRLKQEIETRLAELRPLIAEIEQLEAAKAALLARAELPTAIPAPAPARRRTTRNGAATRRRAVAPSAPKGAEGDGERAPRGANRDAIVKLVEERPGVSVAEIASVTKIAKPTVATTVSKLKREGVFADEAGGVKLASRQAMTISGAAPEPAAAKPADTPAAPPEPAAEAAEAAAPAAKPARRARRGGKRKPARRATAAKSPRRDEGVSDGEWDEAAPPAAEDAAS